MGFGLRSLSGVIVALVLSQAPEFAQQYQQRLGGAIDALAPAVARFDALAKANGLSRDAALARLGQLGDPIALGDGRIRADEIERYESLVAAREALAAADPLSRPAVMMAHFDPDVAIGALGSFAPALPLTVVGLLYGVSGLGVGFCGAHVAMRRRQGTGNRSV